MEIFGSAKGAAKKIFYILDGEPTIHRNKNAGIRLKRFQSSIVFDDVHFSYPSRPDVKVNIPHHIDQTSVNPVKNCWKLNTEIYRLHLQLEIDFFSLDFKRF